MTALWALVVVVNKKVLESVSPVAVNFFIRLATVAGLLLITVPLTALDLWDNGFGINAEAAGWIALAAVAVWLDRLQRLLLRAARRADRRRRADLQHRPDLDGPVRLAAPRHRLRRRHARGHGRRDGGRRAHLPLDGRGHGCRDGGGGRGGALVERRRGRARWPEPRTATSLPDGAKGGAAAAGAGGPDATSAPVRLVALAVLAAAGWGLGPVFIDLAAGAYGHTTATMMLLSQVLGAIMLGGVLLLRRTPLTPRPLSPPERRRAILLLAASGMLEAVVSVLFYLSIEAIGPVLTMLIMATTPVFSIVLGVVFLRERPGLRLTLAAAVTVAGVLIATLDGMR